METAASVIDLAYVLNPELHKRRLAKTHKHRRSYFRLEYRNRYPDPNKYY